MCLVNIPMKSSGLCFNAVAMKASLLMWNHFHRQPPSTTTMSDRALRQGSSKQSYSAAVVAIPRRFRTNLCPGSSGSQKITRYIRRAHPHIPQETSQPLEFALMAPPMPDHDTYNMLPAHFRYSDQFEPVDIVGLFPTKSLLQTMAKNTSATK